ncbi:MAG: hypothetical protein M1830_006861 [Pleopsidium flavum]|nr:MAG: hypothetical protein M1830_006861 [Pleopsidium flavum]
MHFLSFLILTTSPLLSHATALSSVPPVLHFTIARRGGAFPTENVANLTFLAEELEKAEARFNLTRREVRGNKLVRKAKERDVGGKEEGSLMGNLGLDGRWFAKISIGEPPQEVEMDLDMLLSDFYVVTTTSSTGSRYDDFFSQSYVKSNAHPFPACTLPTELMHLPMTNNSLPISFAHCRPSKSSLYTLLASGTMLGLAPSEHLSQTRTPSLLKQLLEKKFIERDIWSLMLINGREGVLSIGGTGAEAVDLVQKQTREELDRIGELERAATNVQAGGKAILKRDLGPDTVNQEQSIDWRDGWRWSKVQGAEGWWQILMQGVWVDGSKVLKNQPVVIDLNTPFILAPPLAARAFYASISGSRPLPPPHHNFHIFPCLNPPVLHFEFSGWRFPAMQGGKGADWWGPPGGKFSLGRLREGSGYCVGTVVETRMGVGEETDPVKKRGRKGGSAAVFVNAGVGAGEMAGNGMRDVWVLGEGFFRGVGGVFDFKEQKVGFRTY